MRAIPIRGFLPLFPAILIAAACSSADPSASSTMTGESAISSAASPQAPSQTPQANEPDASASADRVVFVTSASGGYSLSELNVAGRSQTVTMLDFTAAGVEARDLGSALTTPQTIAAMGSIEGDTFVARAVFQALPDFAPAAGQAFYRVHAWPGGVAANEVNSHGEHPFDRLDLSAASVAFADGAWLSARVLVGSALVSGAITEDGGARVLHVSEIYLTIPDAVSCAPPQGTCAEGTVAMYQRDVNRCLVKTGCTPIGMCPMFLPECASGYELARWPGERGCSQFACDPSFDPAPGL